MTYVNSRLRSVKLGEEMLSLTALKAVVPTDVDHGALIRISDGRTYFYNADSTLTGDDIFVVAPDSGPGRYILAPGFQRIPLTVTSALADAAVLATTPTGFAARVLRGDWGTPSIAFTGGSSSSIGLSSGTATGHTTKGDFLGGASGDVAAAINTGAFRPGTIGADIAAGAYLGAADTIRYDEITSAFTAGTTVAHLELHVFTNPGA